MKKKNLYILLVVIIVVVLIIVLSGPKAENGKGEITNEPEEKFLTEEPEEGSTEEIIEAEISMEEISPAKVNFMMEVGSDGFKPNKFKVTKGITFNWHLINTDEDVSYGVVFDDPFFGNGPIMGVGKGKGEESVRAFVVPPELGEYTFYEMDNPNLKGIMYVVE